MIRHFLLAALLLAAMPAGAVTVGALLGDPVKNLEGVQLGVIDDFIVDVRAGRVLYVIVEGRGRGYTLPVRALDERLRLDMDFANSLARDDSPQDPRFRRAGRLIGQPVNHPRGERIGTISEIEFDLQSGNVKQVVAQTAQGARNLPPSVLAHGRFPPLTRWQVEHPSPRVEGNQGFVRREPSDERNRLHDHKW
jgi:sporulation protein YlmC with PRC-barrel domain